MFHFSKSFQGFRRSRAILLAQKCIPTGTHFRGLRESFVSPCVFHCFCNVPPHHLPSYSIRLPSYSDELPSYCRGSRTPLLCLCFHDYAGFSNKHSLGWFSLVSDQLHVRIIKSKSARSDEIRNTPPQVK